MANIDFQSFSASDNFRLARSKTLYELADGTYNIIQIPKFAFIDQLWFIVTQAYAGGSGGNATIGWTGNATTASAAGFMAAGTTLARAAGTKIMTADTAAGSKGKWFSDGSGCVTITLAASTDSTALRGFVFVRYSVLH
jgi:hypothetical protein